MSKKSHVSMEQQVCIVCCETLDTGAILLDRRLRDSLEPHTTTGFGMCDQCAAKKAEDYVAIIAVDPAQSEYLLNGNISSEGAYRTGKVVHMRSPAFRQILGQEPPEGMVIFAPDDLVNQLIEMTQQQEESDVRN